MADTRHDDLLAALHEAGWLAGVVHQRHDRKGNVALVFGHVGQAQIGVMARPDREAHTTTKRVVRRDTSQKATDAMGAQKGLGKLTWATVKEERPAVKGAGYDLRLGTPEKQESHHAADASAAVEMMNAWLADLPPTHRQVFDAAQKG